LSSLLVRVPFNNNNNNFCMYDINFNDDWRCKICTRDLPQLKYPRKARTNPVGKTMKFKVSPAQKISAGPTTHHTHDTKRVTRVDLVVVQYSAQRRRLGTQQSPIGILKPQRQNNNKSRS
jgi:hypothetical protein